MNRNRHTPGHAIARATSHRAVACILLVAIVCVATASCRSAGPAASAGGPDPELVLADCGVQDAADYHALFSKLSLPVAGGTVIPAVWENMPLHELVTRVCTELGVAAIIHPDLDSELAVSGQRRATAALTLDEICKAARCVWHPGKDAIHFDPDFAASPDEMITLRYEVSSAGKLPEGAIRLSVAMHYGATVESLAVDSSGFTMVVRGFKAAHVAIVAWLGAGLVKAEPA